MEVAPAITVEVLGLEPEVNIMQKYVMTSEDKEYMYAHDWYDSF